MNHTPNGQAIGLAELSPFAGLTDAARACVLAAGEQRRYAPGQFLWREGGQANGLFAILEGRVRMLRVHHGRPYVVHHEDAGSTVGELPLFDGGVYPVTALAATRVRCLFLPEAALWQAMALDPNLARDLLGRLARRIRQLVARLHDVTVGTVRSRLAAHLLARATLTQGRAFTLAGTQAQVAEELGTVREVLARELARLRDDGVIRFAGGGRYAVLDEAALEAIAES